MISLYLENYISNDVKKATKTNLSEKIVKETENPLFSEKMLFDEILVWGEKSRTEIDFSKSQFGNAYTVSSRKITINWDYAKAIENILSDKDRKYTFQEKLCATTAFFITMMDETTLVGSKYNPDPKYIEGGGYKDFENALTDEVFYKADGSLGNLRPYQADKDNIFLTNEVIKTIKNEKREDVLPTIPTK